VRCGGGEGAFAEVPFDTATLTYTIAHNHAITYYDASFLALAKMIGGTLITDDRKQCMSVKGVIVLPLSSYEPVER